MSCAAAFARAEKVALRAVCCLLTASCQPPPLTDPYHPSITTIYTTTNTHNHQTTNTNSYARMSPFMMADAIKTPLLLVHGDADSNPGTHTMQSERFYAALRGHGCPARLVLLPHEGHGYAAREVREGMGRGGVLWGRTHRDLFLICMCVASAVCVSQALTLNKHIQSATPVPLIQHRHHPHRHHPHQSVLHMLYETDQWLERFAGHGRVDPDYSGGNGDGGGNGATTSDGE